MMMMMMRRKRGKEILALKKAVEMGVGGRKGRSGTIATHTAGPHVPQPFA
jgi:hypothetical protein